MAQTTKKALAQALKELLGEKPLDKITVVDIVNRCEVNRQTFYYHFQDIYDLIEWIFLNETTKALSDNKTYDTWQVGFLDVFDYIIANKKLIQNLYKSIAREQLETFLYKEVYNLLISIVNEKAKGMKVRENDKAFIANFFKYALVGLVLDWIGKGMKEDPHLIIKRLSLLIQDDMQKALHNYEKATDIF